MFLSVKDDFARLNALLSGQTDVMAQVPFTQAKSQLVGDVRLIRSPGVTAQAIYMATDKPPFDDVRVRRALRLIVDRRQLVDVALFGFGTVGNDLYGKGLEYYDDSLPQRTRDLAKAKTLLAEAGHGSGLTLKLQTSTVAPGIVEAATLFQQQAKDAGVDVAISQVDPTSYFDPTRDYLKMPFAQTLWQGMTTLGDVYNASVVSKAPYGETHWSDRRTDELVATAVAAPDAAAARSAWAAVQRHLGVYLRAEVGGGLLIGGTEPECDPLQWVDHPDDVGTDVTKAVFEAQATRAARRLSTLTVPNRPRGVVGVYDVTDDWTPIYDKTNLPGYYVAIGTSGNQFKNAPLVGGFLRTIVDQTENGVDHDLHPAVFKGPYTGHTIELSTFSRLRPVNDKNSGTVLG